MKKYKHNNTVLNELEYITSLLVNEKPIPPKYRNHSLSGNYTGIMELHLCPDDLLLYIKIEHESITLVALGSHSELFG
ncbi:MAG: type II toxin-antitoxin system YafQ family toxin [Burkholderiales bacterium]|nr:type II toxin-antitoxin system YafQ family toxin [Burkholderiales bacterium]